MSRPVLVTHNRRRHARDFHVTVGYDVATWLINVPFLLILPLVVAIVGGPFWYALGL